MKGDCANAKLGAPVFGAEKLPKGDIEKTPWKLEKWSSANEAKAHVDATGALDLECGSSNKALLVQSVPLQPFKNYLLTLEVKTEGVRITQKGGHTAVHIEIGGSSFPKEITGAEPWQKISLPFTTGEKTANAKLSLGLGGDGSLAAGHVSFRNVQIRQIGYPESDLSPVPGTTAAAVSSR